MHLYIDDCFFPMQGPDYKVPRGRVLAGRTQRPRSQVSASGHRAGDHPETAETWRGLLGSASNTMLRGEKPSRLTSRTTVGCAWLGQLRGNASRPRVGGDGCPLITAPTRSG